MQDIISTTHVPLNSGCCKHVINRILLIMSMKHDTTIDLYMTEMLHAVWMAVPASMIANCIWHASFGISSGGYSEDLGATANEGAVGDQALASWDTVLDAGVVPGCDTFCKYVRADADAVTTAELTEAEIVRAMMGVPKDDSYECVDDSPEPNVGEPEVRTSAGCGRHASLALTARTNSK